ncbi:ABC transporter ATP-binding protein [Evansella sp. AB-rgal1]|uniref:ABC transporter ATP-binding protein n=1 Tax=Evansella sp. AB-rgal1 TaxID=3242696 RepID=UPI00359D3A63
MSKQQPLIKVQQLNKSFTLPKQFFFERRKLLHVLKNINLTIEKGETLGLVGESGSGKSTLGECIGGLQSSPPETIFYDGKPLETLNRDEFKKYRRNVQFVFQDPYDTLNPRLTIEEILLEPMNSQKIFSTKKERIDRAKELMNDVGLSPSFLKSYPRHLSGGQCQRVAIARALSVQPSLLICDEAVSALDLSVQATILNLLMDLQEKYNISNLFISHDLQVVQYISDRVIVMCQGELVETGYVTDIFQHPKHDYTRSLIDSAL